MPTVHGTDLSVKMSLGSRRELTSTGPRDRLALRPKCLAINDQIKDSTGFREEQRDYGPTHHRHAAT
jgi:hypothetical protein